MIKEEIKTEEAPAAIGPYSQAIKANGFLFCSGQVPINPKSGEVEVVGIKEQTIQVMKNLESVGREAGVGLNSLVKTTIYLKDMNSFAEVNDAYSEFLTEPYPARATIEVARLPLDVGVEIEAVFGLVQGRD